MPPGNECLTPGVRVITSSSTTCQRRPCPEPCIDHAFQSGLTQFDTLPGTSAGSRSSCKPCAPLGAVAAAPERAVHPADPHVVQTSDALGVDASEHLDAVPGPLGDLGPED